MTGVQTCALPIYIYEEKSQEPQEERYPEEVESQEMKVAEKLSLLGSCTRLR